MYPYCFVLDETVIEGELSNHPYHMWLCSSWYHNPNVTPEKV